MVGTSCHRGLEHCRQLDGEVARPMGNGHSDISTCRQLPTSPFSGDGLTTEVNGIVFDAGASAFTITIANNVADLEIRAWESRTIQVSCRTLYLPFLTAAVSR